MILHNGHVYQTGLIKYNVCPHQKNISFVSDLIPNIFSEDGWISVKRCPHFLPHWRGGLWLWGADPLHGAERSTQGRIFRLRLLGFNPCHVTGESCIGCAATRVVPQSNTYVSLQPTAIENGSNETASWACHKICQKTAEQCTAAGHGGYGCSLKWFPHS